MLENIDTPLYYFVAFASLISLLPMARGVYLLITGGRMRREAAALSLSVQPIEAVISDNQLEVHHHHHDNQHHRSTTFRPVVRFPGPDGRDTVAALDTPSSRSYLVGARMMVLVDPADPGRVFPADGSAGRAHRRGALVLIGVGLLMLTVVIGMGAAMTDGYASLFAVGGWLGPDEPTAPSGWPADVPFPGTEMLGMATAALRL